MVSLPRSLTDGCCSSLKICLLYKRQRYTYILPVNNQFSVCFFSFCRGCLLLAPRVPQHVRAGRFQEHGLRTGPRAPVAGRRRQGESNMGGYVHRKYAYIRATCSWRIVQGGRYCMHFASSALAVRLPRLQNNQHALYENVAPPPPPPWLVTQ